MAGEQKDDKSKEQQQKQEEKKDEKKPTPALEDLGLTEEQQEAINKIIGAARVQARNKAKADLDAEAEEGRQKAEREKAAKEGELQKVIDSLTEENAKVKADVKARDLKDRKRAVLAKHKLDADLVDRLQGESDEELEADAKTLVKLFGERKAPDNEVGDKGDTSKPESQPKQPTYSFSRAPKVGWDGQPVKTTGGS